MCLATPGKILSISSFTEQSQIASVDFNGIKQKVRLDFVPEAKVGDYVLVHVGVALSLIDKAEAQRTLELFQELESREDGS